MLTMEQIIEDVQSVPDEHSATKSGHNNTQALCTGSVSKTDNSLNQHEPRNVNKTKTEMIKSCTTLGGNGVMLKNSYLRDESSYSDQTSLSQYHPGCGPGHAGELATIQTNPRDDLTGVVNSSQDDRLTVVVVSNPVTMINKTGSSNEISMENSDQSDMNYSVSAGLNDTSAFTSTHLQNDTSEEYSASYETNCIDNEEATDVVIGEEIANSGIVEDSEQFDQDCSSAASGAFILSRSKKVIDIPNSNQEYSKVFLKDEIASVASSVSTIQSVTEILSRHQAEDSEESDEDANSNSYLSRLSAEHNVSETLTKPREDDFETPDDDDDALRDEKLGRATNIPCEISAGDCGAPSTDCKQLDQELEGDSKVTLPSAYTDNMLSENPKQVVDMFSSKIRKNIDPKFKELDAATKSDDCSESPSENSPDALNKPFSSGRKYGGVSLIISKYNTLLDGAIPPGDKDKCRPKSIKLTQSKDTSNCFKSVNEELDVACHESTNEDSARDDVHTTCDKTKGPQESNQKGDTVFNDSRTLISVDCLHTKRRTNTCEGEENEPSTIEDDNETSERCDTNRNCGDTSLAVAGNLDIENKDITGGNAAIKDPNSFNLLVENVQERKLADSPSTAAVEEIYESNIESPSESNSIWFGSTVDSLEEPFAIDTNESLDADDEFSSLEEYKDLTPRSPISVDENETLYRMRVMYRNEMKGHIVDAKSGILKASCTKDKGKEEFHSGCLIKDEENVGTVPHLTSGNLVVNTCQINNDWISLPNENLNGNDMEVFCDNNSQAASQADKHTTEPCIMARRGNSLVPQLDVDDKEFTYLDAESGDLNEQSEASWEQLVSCCDSGNQYSSEMQECIQLFANEDIKSIESGSIYDDVASGSHHEYSSIVYLSDGPNLKHVSSYCSENESCSNFYSEEGDRKQSDNQDGYLSALDVGEDPHIFRSTEHQEHFDRANESNVSARDGNPNEHKININDKHVEYTTDSQFSPKEEQFMDCMNEENATGYCNTDFMHVIMDTKDNQFIEEESENVTTKSYTNEYVKPEDLINREDITSYKKVIPIGSLDEESNVEPKKVVLSAEDTTETTSEQEIFTNERFGCVPSEGTSTDNEEGSTNQTCLIDIVKQIATQEDGRGKEDNVLNESIVTDEREGNVLNESIVADEREDNVLNESIEIYDVEGIVLNECIVIDVRKDIVLNESIEIYDVEGIVLNESIEIIYDVEGNVLNESIVADVREDNVLNECIVINVRKDIALNESMEIYDVEGNVLNESIEIYDKEDNVLNESIVTDEREDNVLNECIVINVRKDIALNESIEIYDVEDNVLNESIVTDEREDNVLNEIIVVDESNNQEIEDVIATKRNMHKVESKVGSNLNTIYIGDNLSEDISDDTSVYNANGSGSREEDLEGDVASDQLSSQEGGTTNEDDSEALASDLEDEETKGACCKEFQVMWKRMKKLQKAMESLNDQVSIEKGYLEQEADRYKNMPPPSRRSKLSLFEQKLAEVQRERRSGQTSAPITQKEYWRRLNEADQMCGEEIEQMNVAEEKLRHLSRITDVWMRTNVILPYYDPPSLDLAVPEADESPDVTEKKVDELATGVVDMMGPSDAYMTSWLINEADRVKSNYYPVNGNTTRSNHQNLNDLSVDQMLLPPHLLEQLELLRDVVKANSSTQITQHINRSDDEKVLLSNLTENQDLSFSQSVELENQTLVPEKVDGNSEYSETPDNA